MTMEQTIRATLEEGRDATAAALRTLADRIERIDVSDAADVLGWLAPELERWGREAARLLRTA
jgi:hypothetical protein